MEFKQNKFQYWLGMGSLLLLIGLFLSFRLMMIITSLSLGLCLLLLLDIAYIKSKPHQLIKKLPIAVLISANIICAIELGIALYTPHILNSTYLKLNRFYEPNTPPQLEKSEVQWQVYNALNYPKPADLIILGDCSSFLGIQPLILDKLIHLTTWNLGSMAVLGPTGYKLLMDTYIYQHNQPKYIVLNMTVLMLARDEDKIWITALTSWLSPLAEKKSFVLPSYRLRHIVQALIFNSFNLNHLYPDALSHQQFAVPYPLNDIKVQNTFAENHGYLPRIEYDWNSQEQASEKDLKAQFNPDLIDSIKAILDEAKKRHITVFISLLPMPAVSNTPDTVATMSTMYTHLQTITEKYQQVYLHPSYFLPNEQFASIYHLNETGSKSYTEELGAWINSILKRKH